MPKINQSQLEIMRHSCGHLMAAAVQKLFPETKFGIGPNIENGFYYDFELPATLTPEFLPKIKKEMKKMIGQNLPFIKKEMPVDEAIKLFKSINQPYKIELLEEMKKQGEKSVSIYQTGDFIDLCRGPHLKSTGEIGAFKLTKIAGAYWRGNEKNKMLTRIYGLAFSHEEELNNHLKVLEEAEKRDHRNLGKELELFSFEEEIGAGLPIWHPKGAFLRHLIENYLYKELNSSGYQWVVTPHIGNINLWKTSGHWNFYRENIYSPIKIDEEEFLLKPMNCPFHIKIYNSKIRSYKELPIRFAEFGTVYRYEKSGVLHGLTRVRGFTQDDAHIWCTLDQLPKEINNLLKDGLKILRRFGFKDFNIFLSTRPEKFTGDPKHWDKAEESLKNALEKSKLNYQIDPGAGVFYGPKIDIKIKDSLGREWQCTTIQVDFNLPEKFELNYINKEGKKEQPIMIHRALLGSLERFIGVLIEHYAGAFPVWLAPIQVRVVPVGSKHIKASQKLARELKEKDIRCEVDDLNETVGYKVRKAEKQKIPYVLVIGDKEIDSKNLTVRIRGKKEMIKMSRKKFEEKIREEIEKKK